MTRAQLYAGPANTDTVTAMLREWLQLADAMVRDADIYRTNVENPPGDHPWSGETATAIKTMAGNDHLAVENMSAAIKAMAQAGIDAMNNPVIPNLTKAINMVNDLLGQHYLICDDLMVIPDLNSGAFDLSESTVSALAGDCEAKTNELRGAAQAWWDSDQAVADQIGRDKAGLAANFDVSAGLGAGVGRDDGRDLADTGHLSPEEQARLVAAASLPADQAAALAAGKPVVIGAERMAYLYQISQSLNGKTPEEILRIMNGLPSDVRDALSRGLALVSNTNVHSGISNPQGATDATRDRFIPAAGSLANLPSGIRQELTRTDRITQGINADRGPIVATVTLNGVGALQDIAQIFKPAAETGAGLAPAGPTTDGRPLPASSAGYAMNGSEAGRMMLEAASQYANADIAYRSSDPSSLEVLLSDQHGAQPNAVADPRSALAEVISVAGHDHVGVHDLATGAHKDEFLHGFLQENWGADSGKVGAAFNWMDDDPHNPLNSETANSVAHYLGDHLADFQSMPGGGTFGADDPELAQAVAQGLSPYLAALAGADPALTGISGVEHFQDQQHMANMFSVLDQDHTAGATINNAALIQREALELAAAEHGVAGDEIRVATRLGLAMGQGAQDFAHFSDTSAAAADSAQRGSHGVAFDTAAAAVSGVTGLVPGGQIPALIERVLTPGLKHELLDPTSPASQGDHYLDSWLTNNQLNSTDHENATIVQGILNAHPELAHDPDLQGFLSDGRIDYAKVNEDANHADTFLERWLTTHQDLYDPVTFAKQRTDAVQEQEQHRRW